MVKTPLAKLYKWSKYKSKLPAWKLASSCNIAQSTLFRLRNEIVECFYACLEDEQNTLKEIAVTMD